MLLASACGSDDSTCKGDSSTTGLSGVTTASTGVPTGSIGVVADSGVWSDLTSPLINSWHFLQIAEKKKYLDKVTDALLQAQSGQVIVRQNKIIAWAACAAAGCRLKEP